MWLLAVGRARVGEIDAANAALEQAMTTVSELDEDRYRALILSKVAVAHYIVPARATMLHVPWWKLSQRPRESSARSRPIRRTMP